MINVCVNIYDEQKGKKIPTGTRLIVRRCCGAVLQAENINFPVEIDVTFLDNLQMQELNLEYRQKDFPTDVLSFPLGENGIYDKNKETGAAMLGDIAISMDMVKKQAETYGHSVQHELGFLVIHSVLHLLGYDHENVSPIEAAKMREKEQLILKTLGYPARNFS